MVDTLYLYSIVLVAILTPSIIALFFYRGSIKINYIKNNKNYYISRHKIFAHIIILSIFTIFYIYLMVSISAFRHNDELGYLMGNIQPNIWNGRFFPLGHQEFRFLNLKIFNGNYSVLYFPNIIQILVINVCIYFGTRRWGYVAFIGLLASMSGVSLIMFTNLVVPDRNSFFYVFIALVCMFQFLKNPSRSSLFLSLIFASISCYYKEPVFVLWLSLGFGLYLIGKFQANDLMDWAHSKCLALGFLLMSLQFVILYIIFALLIVKPTEIYHNSSSISPLLGLIYNGYYFSAFGTLAILLYLKKQKVSFADFGILLLISAVIYATGLGFINLSLGNNYYYSIPFFLMALVLCWTLSNFSKNILTLHLSIKVLVFITFTVFCFFTFKIIENEINHLKIDRAFQLRSKFLKDELSDLRGYSDITFKLCSASPYVDYTTTIFKNHLEYIKPKTDRTINLWSKSGCFPWRSYDVGDFINCKKSDNEPKRNSRFIMVYDECGLDAPLVEGFSIDQKDVSIFNGISETGIPMMTYILRYR